MEYRGDTIDRLSEAVDMTVDPSIEDIREIVLKNPQYPQGRGCLLRCACHRNDCPICSQFREEANG